MSNTNFDNITGDGTLYTHGLVGLISRHPFLPEELPDGALIYLLHHPKRKRHTWLLENLEEIDEMPQTQETYGFEGDGTPDVAYVCFCVEPEFDYLSFEEEDDYDTYIEWNSGHTMQDIVELSAEEA